MRKCKLGKVIYTKRVKELLEDDYNIHPVIMIENPRDHTLNAWVFEKSDALSFAIIEITSKAKGDKSYGE